MWSHSAQCQVHLWVLRGESDKQQEFWEKCCSEVTPPVRGATQVHMSYTWNGLRSSSWNLSQGIKSRRGVTACQTRRHPASLADPPLCHLPSPLSSCLTPGCHSGAAACSQHRHRRCNVMVRDCQNKCHIDCRVFQVLGKVGRSVECEALETGRVAFIIRFMFKLQPEHRCLLFVIGN